MNWKDIKGQKRSVEQEAPNYRWAHTRTTSTDADYWHCSQLIHGECIKPPLAFWGHYQHLITLLITRLVNEDVNGSCRRSTNEIKPQKEPRKRRHLNSKFKSMFRMPPDSRRLQLARRQRLNIYMYVHMYMWYTHSISCRRSWDTLLGISGVWGSWKESALPVGAAHPKP